MVHLYSSCIEVQSIRLDLATSSLFTNPEWLVLDLKVSHCALALAYIMHVCSFDFFPADFRSLHGTRLLQLAQLCTPRRQYCLLRTNSFLDFLWRSSCFHESICLYSLFSMLSSSMVPLDELACRDFSAVQSCCCQVIVVKLFDRPAGQYVWYGCTSDSPQSSPFSINRRCYIPIKPFIIHPQVHAFPPGLQLQPLGSPRSIRWRRIVEEMIHVHDSLGSGRGIPPWRGVLQRATKSSAHVFQGIQPPQAMVYALTRVVSCYSVELM